MITSRNVSVIDAPIVVEESLLVEVVVGGGRHRNSEPINGGILEAILHDGGNSLAMALRNAVSDIQYYVVLYIPVLGNQSQPQLALYADTHR